MSGTRFTHTAIFTPCLSHVKDFTKDTECCFSGGHGQETGPATYIEGNDTTEMSEARRNRRASPSLRSRDRFSLSERIHPPSAERQQSGRGRSYSEALSCIPSRTEDHRGRDVHLSGPVLPEPFHDVVQSAGSVYQQLRHRPQPAQAMMMADALSSGIAKQFPGKVT